MNLIRKISIGRDYKNDAMHYSIGQEVFGGHKIVEIIEEDEFDAMDTDGDGVVSREEFEAAQATKDEFNSEEE